MTVHHTRITARFEIVSFRKPSAEITAPMFGDEIRKVLDEMARRHNFSAGELTVTVAPVPDEAKS